MCIHLMFPLHKFVSAPLCSPPPDVPLDGFLNISRPIHPVQNVDTCRTDAEDLVISCPSFLTIYIRAASYSRKAAVPTMCTGERDPGPAADCTDPDVVQKVRAECHGSHSCVLTVAGSLADLGQQCGPKKKELHTTHTCGNNIHSNTLLFLLPPP